MVKIGNLITIVSLMNIGAPCHGSTLLALNTQM